MLDATTLTPTEYVRSRILKRNAACTALFEREALPLARACSEMAARFARGGRLVGFGKGAYATDAMHVSVEFVHPVLVGKRALPALDVSMDPGAWLNGICSPDDMVVAFAGPQGDAEQEELLGAARRKGAMTIAFPGNEADYAVAAPVQDEHVHQELFELLGHSMYESVHVFLEHRMRQRQEPGEAAASFLYPFLQSRSDGEAEPIDDVAASIELKARDANALRARVARRESESIVAAAHAIRERLARGGTILAFGNGGSATDATDFALDCVAPAQGWPAIRALSLALEPAVITATANDVGTELIFVRQLIAQSKPQDVAMAFSTSGGSRNVLAALEEARKRGLLTIALLGYDGGEIARRELADIAIVVESDDIPRIQEAQATVYHTLREILARD